MLTVNEDEASDSTHFHPSFDFDDLNLQSLGLDESILVPDNHHENSLGLDLNDELEAIELYSQFQHPDEQKIRKTSLDYPLIPLNDERHDDLLRSSNGHVVSRDTINMNGQSISFDNHSNPDSASQIEHQLYQTKGNLYPLSQDLADLDGLEFTPNPELSFHNGTQGLEELNGEEMLEFDEEEVNFDCEMPSSSRKEEEEVKQMSFHNPEFSRDISFIPQYHQDRLDEVEEDEVIQQELHEKYLKHGHNLLNHQEYNREANPFLAHARSLSNVPSNSPSSPSSRLPVPTYFNHHEDKDVTPMENEVLKQLVGTLRQQLLDQDRDKEVL